jgi:phosphoribosyl-ATP pyrophosphohydrolase/phosphoribosyl-AMP cyclohydrolase
MIIPSIDIQKGNAVQLVGGKEKKIDGGDPIIWARQFGLASEIAVIDLDSAMQIGDNLKIIKSLVSDYQCRVGGGIRTVELAKELLNLGAKKIIIGTKATAEFLQQLPKERIIAALDARYGQVVIDGWNTSTSNTVEDKIKELKDYVGGFLVTLVETEGSLKGIDINRCRQLKELCGDIPLTVAGGVSTIEEIAQLDDLGIDVQVGMALYSKLFTYADAVVSPLIKKSTGPWPTIVCDQNGQALGLVWSTRESINIAFAEQRGVYYSRSRNKIWRKGETSGATQELIRVDLDCDRDCLRFTVKQKAPGFCHTKNYSCWGPSFGFQKLSSTLLARKSEVMPGSYTQKLFQDPQLLNAKIVEEAQELVDANTKEQVILEATDLIYFALAKLATHQVDLSEIESELDRRSLKIIRRAGDKKDLKKVETWNQ